MAASEMTVSVVTPEETVVETTADAIVAPLFDGEIGILRGHAPMISRLGYGELRVTAAGASTRYYVDGGFIQVADNVVSVMTNRAMPAADVDGEAAAEALQQGLDQKAQGDDAILARQRAVDQARAQVRLAKKG
ncbi:MAG: ATP synthase F1 subunit epsilon [Planctomycetota bacterium]